VTASIERASPLKDWSSRFETLSAKGQFAIREIPFATQINLRGNAEDSIFSRFVAALLGCELPSAANTWSASPDCTILWLGPDEWLIVAQEGRNEALVEDLGLALAGLHHAITDVSANRTILEVSGADARVVLAKGCPLDLHRSAFAPPQCAQSVIAKSQVILQCVDEEPTFRIFVRLSFAAYLAEWILDAAEECIAAGEIGIGEVAGRLA
jgi:sarcosine oxidase subunit gamma